MLRWATHGGKLTVILDQPPGAVSSAALARDVRRVRVFTILMCVETGVGVRPSISYALQPASIIASDAIPTATLRLSPATTLGNITDAGDKKSVGAIVTVDRTRMMVTTMGTPSKLERCEKFAFVPYWWVQTTPDESMANMRIAVTKVDGDTIPVPQNTVSVSCKTRVLVFKANDSRTLTEAVLESASASQSSSKRAKKA